MNIKKLTYEQYFYSKNKKEIDAFIPYVKPATKLKIKDKVISVKYNPLSMVPLGEYIYLFSPSRDTRFITADTKDVPVINLPLIAFPIIFRRVDRLDVLSAPYLNVVAVQKWLTEQANIVQSAFENVFREKDLKWVQAGGKDMDRFKFYNLINFVTAGDITKEEEIKKIPIYQIIIYADHKLSKNRIEKRMADIANNKRKI